jgi:hypothetical protein
VTIRPYRDEDERSVLDLLATALGPGPAGVRSAEFFRWKHQRNPFGRSLMLVGEDEGRIVGLRAFMRWRFRSGEKIIDAVRAVDTATHPRDQGRGVFTLLTVEGLKMAEEVAALVFNTPNEKSLPGYLKMGWQVVGRVPFSVRVRRPLSFVAGMRRSTVPGPMPGPPPVIDGETAGEALRDESAVTGLLSEANADPRRLRTQRDHTYLQWRYGQGSPLDYRAVRLEGVGVLHGLAIFRVRPRGSLWESTIAELIVRNGDGRAARTLLQRVSRAARVTHLTCAFPRGSSGSVAAHRVGYLRSPRGITLVAHPLHGGIEPDPGDMDAWSLSVGDVEVF